MARTAEDVRRLRPDRVPPQNLEAEESVLGSMMLSAEAIADVVEILQPDDFYRRANGKIYDDAPRALRPGRPRRHRHRGRGAEAPAGIARGRRRAPLHARARRAGPDAGLRAATTRGSSSQTALLRRLIRRGGRHHGDGVLRAGGARGRRRRRRAAHLRRRAPRGEGRGRLLRELVDQAMVDLEKIQNRESAYTGLPTGFRDLDVLHSGLQPGNLIVVAARPGVGQVVARHEHRAQRRRRRSASRSPCSRSRCRAGRSACGCCARRRASPWDRDPEQARGTADDWSRIVQAAETLHDAPLHIVDAGNVDDRRHPREGPAHALAPPGASADHRRLPPADDASRAASTTASRRSPRSAARPEDAREGAHDPGHRALAAEP